MMRKICTEEVAYQKTGKRCGKTMAAGLPKQQTNKQTNKQLDNDERMI